jgi:hypothetical protein
MTLLGISPQVGANLRMNFELTKNMDFFSVLIYKVFCCSMEKTHIFHDKQPLLIHHTKQKQEQICSFTSFLTFTLFLLIPK